MKTMRAANGQTVTEEMIAGWSDALDRDEWPSGWRNVGEIINGRLPSITPRTEVLSVKVPSAMKRAVEREALAEGVSTSEFVRSLIASSLLDNDVARA
jgi:hypothetical protein